MTGSNSNSTLNLLMKRWFLLVLLAALILRLVGISSRPLWYDEAFSVLFAEKGPQAMLAGTLGTASTADGQLSTVSAGAASEEHPLLYYTLLWLWMKIFGQAPAAVRALSVLFGLATIALVFALGRTLFEDKTAVLMAALVALAPFQVHYAQEVRMYAALATFITAAGLALWRGMHGGSWLWWLIFAVMAALAQYTHSIAVIYLVLLALTPLLARRWKAALAAGLASLFALFLYLPWLAQLPSQLAKIQAGYWMQPASPGNLVTALLSYVTNLPLPSTWLPAGLFVTLIIVALAAWQTWRAWRDSRHASQSTDGESSCSNVMHGLWLAYLAFAPLLALYLVSQVQPVFVERALLPAGVFFWMWVAWSLMRTNMPRPVMAAALGAVLVGAGMGLIQHTTYMGFPYAPYAALGDSLAQRLDLGEVIVHSNKISMLPSVYTHRDLVQRYVADPDSSGSDTLGIATQHTLGLLADGSIQAAANQAQGVWFIIFDRAEAEYLSAGYTAHPHLEWLNDHYRLLDREQWGDLKVYHYREK